jgi:hypothetical protein
MTQRINIIGQRFGRLTVLEYRGFRKGSHWLCQCDCGTQKILLSGNLRYENGVRSCGCVKKPSRTKTHGKTHTPEYTAYNGMHDRCENPKCLGFKNYGGRGIRVEWQTFEAFYADMGPRPSPKHSIERKDNDGNYSKENCVWATRDVQAHNKRSNHRVIYEGKSFTLTQLAKHCGCSYGNLKYRLRVGYSVELAVGSQKLKSGFGSLRYHR